MSMNSVNLSKRNLNHYDVVIVGGGFSGSILAAQLLRKARSAISIGVVDRSLRRSRGIAYSTRVDAHLLNVPAGKMSAFPDDAEHFLRWAQAHYDGDVQAGSFVPRRVYGEYIEATLREAQAASNGRLEWIQDEVVAVTRRGNEAELNLADGRKLIADRVVLALGNFRPSDPLLPGKTEDSKRYLPFAWDEAAITEPTPKGDILLVGSGLTCVDIAIMLRARGFTGAVHVLSRRGLLPRRHRATKPWPGFWNAHSPRTVLGLLRLMRQQVRAAHKQGVDWRGVVDSLRPVTAEIWASLPMAEKRRFLRHARPYWEVHRHRVAPEIGDFLGGQIADHDIQAHAGRITRYDERADHVEVTYHDRMTGREAKLRVGLVINCTGPENDARRLNHPLLNQLFAQGFARHDDLYLGLDVATNGTLIEASGLKSEFLYTVGPTRKGSLWETTAVPEIRVQVAHLAEELLGELGTEDRASHAAESATQTV
jgi:uncharacterized NAD(P)/FAD-binding protein YdhS